MRKGNSRLAAYRILADRYRDIVEKLPPEAEHWHRELGRQAYSDLKDDLLTGKRSSKQLRKDGHPFAKSTFKAGKNSKKKRVAVPSLPINEQKGTLRRGLFLQESLFTDGQRLSLGSTAKHNKWILDPRGTKKMIGRGVMTGHLFGMTTPGEIERRWRSRKKIFNDRFRRRMNKK